MLARGGGGKGGPLLIKWLLGSMGNNGPLTGGGGGGTKPEPAASLSAGRVESGTFEFCNKFTLAITKTIKFITVFLKMLSLQEST
jgi:hypothetical protein